jgi:DNA polymerase-3 subunit gamma/tau
MSYLVLARKYRPQTFEDLVGQNHATVTLINALEAKRLAHAYVFSGPRGCGKTTTARLLAKALNCVKGPTPTPCGECPQCKEIAGGTSTDDVLEIDGASNRGIDQIRELRDTVKYAPARCRYRIYIIDEAHQITDAGFNALLKTLEEPPPHAVFMMATTELHKFPATILSRCQRFQLRPIPLADTQKRLEEIMKKEKLKADPEALLEVARAAHGSLRDALSLLDQAIAYAPDGVTAGHIRSLLGLLPRATVREFNAALLEGTPEKVLQAVQKAVENGFDLQQLGQDLLSHWHEVLLWKSGVRDATLPNAAELEEASRAHSVPDLERRLQIITLCLDQMRRSEAPRVTFELACLEIAKKALSVEEILLRLESLEKSLKDGDASPRPSVTVFPARPADVKKNSELTAPSSPRREEISPEAPAPAAGGDRAAASSFPSPSISTATKIPAPQESRPAPASPTVRLDASHIQNAWKRLLEEVSKKKPSLEPFLRSAAWEWREGQSVELVCGQEFQREHLTRNLPILSEAFGRALAECAGDPAAFVSLRCVLKESPAQGATAPANAAPGAQGGRPLDSGKTADSSVLNGGGSNGLGTRPTPSGGLAEAASDSNAPDHAEVVGEDGADDLSDDGADAPEPEAVPSPAISASTVDVPADGIDPVVKKFMERFPGKLKKIEETV